MKRMEVSQMEVLRDALEQISDLALMTHAEKKALYLAKTGEADERGESYIYICSVIRTIARRALEQTREEAAA